MPTYEASTGPSLSQGGAVHFGPIPVGGHSHICAFFNSMTEGYGLLLPFIKEGLQAGDHAFLTMNPALLEEHVQQLQSADPSVAEARRTGQLNVTGWDHTHVIDGAFTPEKTMSFFARASKKAKDAGALRTRFVTDMGWSAKRMPGIEKVLEYEARANVAWLGPINPFMDAVVCAYDLSQFGAGFVIDVMRTHPMVLIGDVLQRNPFYVEPDDFLRELRERARQ